MNSLMLLLALYPASATSAADGNLTMYQLDLVTDTGHLPSSNWGACDVSFVWQGIPLYFNVSLNGQWVVQNILLFSGDQPGEHQRIRANFPLPVPPGQPFPVGQVAFSLTPNQSGPPSNFGVMPFVPMQYEIYAGSTGQDITIGAPVTLVGCLVQDPPAAHAKFPNQECGPMECIPAAVSNSLKFLNAKHEMGLDDKALGIDKMKAATGWKKDAGAPNATWDKTKDKYCKLQAAGAAGPHIPVTTRRLGNHQLDTIEAEIRAGQDVEIGTDTHCMALVGIAACADGYTIQVAHDTKQGKDGGTVTETGTISKTSRKISGIPFVNGQVVRYMVVECPKK